MDISEIIISLSPSIWYVDKTLSLPWNPKPSLHLESPKTSKRVAQQKFYAKPSNLYGTSTAKHSRAGLGVRIQQKTC